MADSAATKSISAQARRGFVEQVLKALPSVAQALAESQRQLVDKPAEPATALRRREAFQSLIKVNAQWARDTASLLGTALRSGGLPSGAAAAVGGSGVAPLSLVDDDTIEREILTSRLALAMLDRAGAEFADMRARVLSLERADELDEHDVLRSHVLAKCAIDAWRRVGLDLTAWRDLAHTLHDEFADVLHGAYNATNRVLASHGVMPEVNLRPYIRRSQGVTAAGGMAMSGAHSGSHGAGYSVSGPSSRPGSLGPYGAAGHGGTVWSDDARGGGSPSSPSRSGVGSTGRGLVGEETRMMTRHSAMPRSGEHAEAVLGRLNRLVGRHLPGFAQTTRPQGLSPQLNRAIDAAQVGIRQRLDRPGQTAEAVGPVVTTPALLEELHQRKQALKQAATSPDERATIEIVALLFQSILMEDRIPATVRVWFARLQMPVLRVAVSEPDFFATIDHPARRLIDRMGACVMGFDSGMRGIGDALDAEIKRVVQVVEAYPDTGRRVFQTVLIEFEKFLEHTLKNQNEATRKAISLAQQVEQRETLAVQYTIELRKMLNEMPVAEGVREFLFQHWADVLATAAIRYGAQSEETRALKRAATDLIWSAAAKVSRDERAEVIRRLPPLLKQLREGMASAGVTGTRQDDAIRALNNSLASAFTAKAAVISSERLQELTERLESLEDLLPEAEDVQIDESIVLDLAGQEGSEIEVISEGGSMPSPAMLAWARELQMGAWFMLEGPKRTEPVQLAWHGLRRQLLLFVTPQGRCVLFQQQRLAAYLQAGLLLPAQDEALTVRATRSALAKLDVDPSRLLN
jgi:hypothetical protein